MGLVRLLGNLCAGATVVSASLLSATAYAEAAELRVAVAANFRHALADVAIDYQQLTGVKVQLSSGATGALYTQILHGAPYDLFFAADAERPQLLEENGRAQIGSRVTYATGLLAFWSPSQNANEQLLQQWSQRLSIANPRTAPYGVAAEQALARINATTPPLVRGSNILQAYQYVQSGNAKAGLVAISHLKADRISTDEYWPIPQAWYDPIAQQAVVLKRSKHLAAACHFLRFVVEAEPQLQANGYKTQGIDGAQLEQRCLADEIQSSVELATKR